MVNPNSLKNFSIPLNPWVYFFIFLTANILLSYVQLPLQTRLWVGLFGLLIPFGLALSNPAYFKVKQTPYKIEFIPPIPLWVWIPIGIGALFVRFYKLTTLSVWPLYDDSLWGWMALRFCQKESWSLFYAGSNFPGAYAWGLGLLFKYFNPSLFTLWFFPAFLSTLTAGVGFGAARQFFSKSSSFLVGLLLAFGFWPIYVGRIADQMSLVLLAECAFLGMLGLFLKARPGAPVNLQALGLGLAAGAGFYIFISWATVAALVGATVLLSSLSRRSPSWTPFLIFSAAALILLVPLWESGLKDSVASYSTIGFWSQPGANPWGQLQTSLSYLTVIFWGMDPSSYTYQPVWGGFLDPLLGAFFGLGLLELLRRGGKQTVWLAIAFVLFLIPGMVTTSREPLRVLPVLPPLLIVCAFGWEKLLISLPSKKRLWVLFCLAVTFASLDFYHLAVKYHHLWNSPAAWRGYSKSPERFRAHFILEKIASDQGPGLVYDDFVPGLCDQSLSVLDNPYNAAQNPTLSFQNAHWAAVLANTNDKPFLSQRFPRGRAYALSEGLDRPDGGWMLWTTPISSQSESQFKKWQKASEAFECYPHEDPFVLLPMLEKAYPTFAGDPFLESCYWEKWSDLSYRASNFKALDKSILALQQAIKKGYPSANLYWHLGVFQLMSGDSRAARQSLELAMKAPLNLTSAAECLKQITESSTSRRLP